MKISLTPARGAIAAALVMAAVVPAEAQLRQALETGEQATRQAEQIQTQINQLDDERSDMVREYRTILQRRDAAELFARQQEKVVESQEREIVSLTDQLSRVDEITAETVPMMLDMITDLKAFVAADLPFKQAERQIRLDGLDAAMEDPQVSTAERYRLIIQAYQNEMEYGRTIDTWSEDVQVGDATKTVDFFQYGRVALVWIDTNDREGQFYNRVSGQWEPLPGGMVGDVREAIRVASGKKQQEVLFGPVQKFSVQ
ncbi:MAG: DUF3450 domain-containing protein [Pseudomonadota bacterium]